MLIGPSAFGGVSATACSDALKVNTAVGGRICHGKGSGMFGMVMTFGAHTVIPPTYTDPAQAYMPPITHEEMRALLTGADALAGAIVGRADLASALAGTSSTAQAAVARAELAAALAGASSQVVVLQGQAALAAGMTGGSGLVISLAGGAVIAAGLSGGSALAGGIASLADVAAALAGGSALQVTVYILPVEGQGPFVDVGAAAAKALYCTAKCVGEPARFYHRALAPVLVYVLPLGRGTEGEQTGQIHSELRGLTVVLPVQPNFVRAVSDTDEPILAGDYLYYLGRDWHVQEPIEINPSGHIYTLHLVESKRMLSGGRR